MAFNFYRLFSKSVINFLPVPQRGIKRHVSRTALALWRRGKKFREQVAGQDWEELNRRSNFLEWNYSAEVFAFGKRLNEEFPPELLVQAFTHRSYIIKEQMKHKDLGVESTLTNLKVNDDLSSAGEKIISNYSARYVSYFFPRFPLEGIESISSYLTSDEVLAHISKNLGTTFLILSGDYPVEMPTYSKTLKAIVGALEQCQGLKRSELFVRDFIVTQLAGKDLNEFLNLNNPFEVLSEILKRDGRAPPEPRIIFQSGMNTILANYHIGIYSDKQLLGHCSGESLDIATEMAAFDVLRRLFHTTDSCTPMSFDVTDIPETISNLRLSEWNSATFKK